MRSAEELDYDLALYAREWLRDRFAISKELAMRVADDPDPVAVHEARTSCRRLRESAAFFAGVSGLAGLSSIERRARRLMRSLSKLREIDVALKRVPSLGGATLSKAAASERERMVNELARARRREVRKRAPRIRKRAVKLCKELSRWESAGWGGASSPPSKRDTVGFFEQRLSERREEVLRLSQVYARAKQQGHGAEDLAICLHQIRVGLKHWRYAHEICKAALPVNGTRSFVLRRLQALGGDAQDFRDLVRQLESGRDAAIERRRRALGELLAAAELERKDKASAFEAALLEDKLLGDALPPTPSSAAN